MFPKGHELKTLFSDFSAGVLGGGRTLKMWSLAEGSEITGDIALKGILFSHPYPLRKRGLPWGKQLCSTMHPCHEVPSHHGSKSNRAKRPWTKNSEAMSPNVFIHFRYLVTAIESWLMQQEILKDMVIRRMLRLRAHIPNFLAHTILHKILRRSGTPV